MHLKADVPDETLTMATWTRLYGSANWHERETFEMFGITFDGHPSLRKLYLPGGFEGFRCARTSRWCRIW
ncbi:MAG: NADH-quinone oxidoreductase subunit C [Acidimicrobiales bacterium]